MKPRHWLFFSAVCMACAAKPPPPKPPEPKVVDEGPKWPDVKCVETPVTSPVATFDPDADIVLTGGGGKRPDEYTLSLVFACQDDAVSRCVGAEREILLAEAEARAAEEERLAKKKKGKGKGKGKSKAKGKNPSAAKGPPKGEGEDSSSSGGQPGEGSDPDGPDRIEPGVLVGDGLVQVLLDPEGEQPLGVNVTLPQAYAHHQEFVQCLQLAAAAAPYPQYDGPPFVVEFEFELDPGYEIYDDAGGELSSASAVEAPGF